MARTTAGTTRQDGIPTLVVYGRRDCHLCDVALAELEELRDLLEFHIEKRDVDDDPRWASRWGDEVPVGLVGDDRIFKYRVEPARVARALRARGARPRAPGVAGR